MADQYPAPRVRTSSRGADLAAGTAKVMVAEGLALPAGIITASVLGRTLGPADYGVFAAATSLVLTLEWVSTLTVLPDNRKVDRRRRRLAAGQA